MVHSSSGLYGADRCLLWIAQGLIKRGVSVEAVLPFSGILEAELKGAGVPVHVLEPVVFRRSIMKPAAMARLAAHGSLSLLKLCKLIRNQNFDLVHSNTGVVIGGAIAARLCGKPHVWHFREMLTEFRHYWTFHEPLVNLTSKEIVCISRAVAGQFDSQRIRAKTTVVYDGVPVPAQGPENEIKSRNGKTRLLTVGLLAPYKGQDILIEAVKKLVDEGLDIELTVVGDVFGGQVGYRNELINRVAETGLKKNVFFEGFCENVDPYFEKSDIFVLPSGRPEGLGLVVLEAMARGRPVIATRGGGVNEIITDEENGLLAEPGEYHALAAAIRRLNADKDLARSLSEKGRATVVEKFSLEGMIENLTRIYRRALS